ncbi:MAG: hypothetical protein KAT05_07980 [Spirochaetes bacterium]|nr:hypothetical protein [Spirochaetota bacterium]
MKKLLLIITFWCLFTISYSQQNDFFIKLSEKKLATFNDGITLMKLLYNERDDNSVYIDNILWAAGKKMFKVSIPIKTDQINPVLTRREFAYWISKIFNARGGLVNSKKITRYLAYKVCVNRGILAEGRGPFDSFTGAELLGTFAYLDYYVRYNEIRPKQGKLEIYDDTYKNLPEWRDRLHRELEEQRAKEKELKEKKRKKRFEKTEKNIKKEKQSDEEKYIEKKIEE